MKTPLRLRIVLAVFCLLSLGADGKPCTSTSSKKPEPVEPGADETAGEPTADSSTG
jgi:hypothetical protein